MERGEWEGEKEDRGREKRREGEREGESMYTNYWMVPSASPPPPHSLLCLPHLPLGHSLQPPHGSPAA